MRRDDMIDVIDHALNDWAVSGDAMRWTPDSRLSLTDLQPNPAPITFTIETNLEPFMRAMAEMQRSLAAAFLQAAPALDQLVAAFRSVPIKTADKGKRTRIRQQYRSRALARRRR